VIKKKHTSLLRRVPCGGEITCLAIVRITAWQTDEESLTRLYICFTHVAVFDTNECT
jgi:hypothetical protein